MKLRLNIIVLILAAVLAALLVVSGFLLFQGISKYSSAEKRASKLFSTLSHYYDANPFPSPANVEIKEANAAMFREWADRLVGALKEGESSEIEKSPLLFMRRLGDTRNSLLAAAQAQGMGVRQQFTFGFEQYLGEQPRLPPPPLVPQLTHQLVAIDTITRVLIENGASSLDSIIREDLEAKAAAARPGGPNLNRPGRPDPRGIVATVAEGEKAEGLFTSERLVVEFQAREEVAVRVVNALAAMPLPVAVARIAFHRSQPDVILPVQQTLDPGAEVKVEQSNLFHKTRVVSGPGIGSPSRVRLELNIYRFSEGESGESD